MELQFHYINHIDYLYFQNIVNNMWLKSLFIIYICKLVLICTCRIRKFNFLLYLEYKTFLKETLQDFRNCSALCWVSNGILLMQTNANDRMISVGSIDFIRSSWQKQISTLLGGSIVSVLRKRGRGWSSLRKPRPGRSRWIYPL